LPSSFFWGGNIGSTGICKVTLLVDSPLAKNDHNHLAGPFEKKVSDFGPLKKKGSKNLGYF